MKIVIFNTIEQATEYFNRDYRDIFERIVDNDTKLLTIENFSPKQRQDGKYTYPALDGADYTGIQIAIINVPEPIKIGEDEYISVNLEF